ncbi:membrane protein; putative [Ruegeria sp. TM1040]|uniref:hypothetical protein n=1 Tax=Ruegeria sp. (strain TM1040) TaxID=292414 RepID=UPI0000557B98|nr:hypothetical protein [Ruegeria sp. TM1040]ABF65616.1 membrane protein; putative [Ruegeria sp. TM1040]
MTGWKIFSHSLGMVLRNLGWAVQIALVPVLIAVVCIAALLWTHVGELIASMGRQGYVPSGAFITSILLSVAIFIMAQLWVFVNWHRFVLLEEYPTSWFPTIHGDRMLAYFGTGLLLGLIMALAWIAGGIFSSVGSVLGSPVISLLILFIVMVGVGLLFFRLMPTLPAAAIGNTLSLRESWEATKGTAGTAVVLFIVLVGIQIVLQAVTNLSIYIFAPLGLVFALVSALIMTLVNVSILTTVYGHYVQGRSI